MLTELSFYIFLPICIFVYYLMPAKARYIWLLLCSYYFYCSLDGSFTTLLIASTIITWLSGGFISKVETQAQKKVILAIGTLLNLSILLFFKYGDFFLSLTNTSKRLGLLLPVGISFYTFQSLTYIFDIYNGDAKPEKNIFKYALFVSFFPLILSGPIERAKHLIPQLNCDSEFNASKAKTGLQLMLFGYFLKIVIVARMAILTDHVFTDYLNQNSVALIIAVLAYAVQIYCDFAGYSYIAIGMCEIMGIDIIKNFRQPYFATSVSDFWRRWHISLSTWFKDYLYIPLGGNRKGQFRKYINLIIVFLVSGLWHGANLTFVFWGVLNGIYQVIGDLIKNTKKSIFSSKLLRDKDVLSRILQTVITFILISFTWIFFRANSIYEAFEIIGCIGKSFSYVNLFDGTIWSVGLGVKNMLIALFAVAILIFADVICEKRNCEIYNILDKVKAPIRWATYYLLILLILFSMNLNMTEFIYSGF